MKYGYYSKKYTNLSVFGGPYSAADGTERLESASGELYDLSDGAKRRIRAEK